MEKNIFNLDFLVNIQLQDKQLYLDLSNEKQKQKTKNIDECKKEGKLIEGDIAYYKPFVRLYFVDTHLSYTREFDNFSDASNWADEMGEHIKNKLIL